jgi:urea transport system permease protein
MSSVLRAILLVLIAWTFASAAHADNASLTTIVEGFAKDSFSATNKTVLDLGASGEARAAAILSALKDERLFFTKEPEAVFVRAPDGTLTDAITGKPVPAPPADALQAVRLNNRVRGTLSAALGTVMLAAPDPLQRTRAAQTIFTTRDAAALPALNRALTVEHDPTAKSAMTQAKAALIALKADAPETDRIAAIKIVASTGGYDGLAILDQTIASSSGAVQKAAADAKASVQFGLSIWDHVNDIVYGLSLGSVLLLAAIGLAITFGVMGVINMAHGEMVMLGAYATFIVQQLIHDHAPGLFEYSLLLALPVAFVFTGLVGILIERTVIRFLYGRPLETLLATFGVSLILQQLVRTIFGANNQSVGAPAFMSGTFQLGGLSITSGRLWIVVFSIAVFFALQGLLRLTPFGLRIRAVTQNRRMASAMGIDTNRIDALAFGLGSGVAGIAGVALSQIDNVSPNLGQSYIIDSFMVVVFGGVGNLWGTLVAALTLGVGNKVLEPVAGAVLAKIAILVFIILFIQKKPRGLFALKGRSVEA